MRRRRTMAIFVWLIFQTYLLSNASAFWIRSISLVTPRPPSPRTETVGKQEMVGDNHGSIWNHFVSPSTASSLSVSSSFRTITTSLQSKNGGGHRSSRSGPKNNNIDNDDKEKSSPKRTPPPVMNFIMIPLVALVGVDLILNILFLTKRTLEAIVLGQAPSAETWW